MLPLPLLLLVQLQNLALSSQTFLSIFFVGIFILFYLLSWVLVVDPRDGHCGEVRRQ